MNIHGVLNRPFTDMLSSEGGKGGRDVSEMSLMGEMHFLAFERSELDRK